MDSETELEMAERHVREGTDHVARQRLILEKLRRDGHDCAMAGELLAQFEVLLDEHRRHLDHIIAEIRQTRERR